METRVKTIYVTLENYKPWANRLINLNNAQENCRIGFDEKLSVGAQFAQLFLEHYSDDPISVDGLIKLGFAKTANTVYSYMLINDCLKYDTEDKEWYLDGRSLQIGNFEPETMGDVKWLLDKLRRSKLRKTY